MMKDINQWIDITTTIESGMVHWPGDVPVEIKKSKSMEDGAGANVTALSMSAHTATHLDAQLHFIRNGKDITEIPLSVLVGKAKVFEIKDPEKIGLAEIKDFQIEKGDRVLFKTHNSESAWTLEPFHEDYIYLATDAAEFLKAKGVLLVGIDYLSIAGESNGAEVHRLLLGSEIVVIEGLNLKNIRPGEYDLICLPLKIKGADGAPARVIIKQNT